ncbi:hypothetical protein T11_6941 [Trichinella zimbabwensis]|uniref:Uncharacterized protein n=1 Tax=Trichinella zimbabwensis TaxID=268475 RepID=A0A0V1I7I3_9BILA|nr:hypothetical protein T11_6941 [Trichinella zimbabwensis]
MQFECASHSCFLLSKADFDQTRKEMTSLASVQPIGGPQQENNSTRKASSRRHPAPLLLLTILQSHEPYAHGPTMMSVKLMMNRPQLWNEMAVDHDGLSSCPFEQLQISISFSFNKEENPQLTHLLSPCQQPCTFEIDNIGIDYDDVYQ